MSRSILHIDMDAFYAAIEQRDHPELRGQPVIIGGEGARSVVSTASYEARKFGVRSAMPSTQARRLCPQGIFVPPRIAYYAEVSQQVFEIFERFTPQVEGLSLDEAFLDVGASLKLHGSAEHIASTIRAAIRAELGLTASVGVAHNKLLAKLASEMAKPDGCLVLRPEETQDFLDPLPVSRMWGVGQRTQAQLEVLGVHTLRQLREADTARLRRVLGNQAEVLQARARGEDLRAVEPARRELSIGAEETYAEDIREFDTALSALMRLSERACSRLRLRGLAARTVSVKLRTPRFETVTRQRTLEPASNDTAVLFRSAQDLLTLWWRQQVRPELRLLGLALSGLESPQQGDLLSGRSRPGLDPVADRVNMRFGSGMLRRGRAIKKPG